LARVLTSARSMPPTQPDESASPECSIPIHPEQTPGPGRSPGYCSAQLVLSLTVTEVSGRHPSEILTEGANGRAGARGTVMAMDGSAAVSSLLYGSTRNDRSRYATMAQLAILVVCLGLVVATITVAAVVEALMLLAAASH